MDSGVIKFRNCIRSRIPDDITDDDFEECLQTYYWHIQEYETTFRLDLMTSYVRFNMLIDRIIRLQCSLNIDFNEYHLKNYMNDKFNKHQDYLIRNIKEEPEKWVSLLQHIGKNNEFLTKMVCEHLPYIESLQQYLLSIKKYVNAELFVKLSQSILRSKKLEIQLNYRDRRKTYYLCDPCNYEEVDCRFPFYGLHIRYDTVNFKMCDQHNKPVILNSRIYNIMKLLIRKQKLIKPAKNFSNVDTLEKMWKLDFMRSFEYHKNLRKLLFSYKI